MLLRSFEYGIEILICFNISRSPANAQYYNHFDGKNDEHNTTDIERPIEMPRTIEEVMKDVIVFVEVRSGTENRTNGIKGAIANLGAKVNDRLLR